MQDDVSYVDDPTDLTGNDYRAVAKATLNELKADDIPSLASAVAFRIFLSLFPALLAAVAAFGLFTSPEELPGLLDSAADLLPPAALEVLRPQLEDLAGTTTGAASGLLTVGVLGGLWAAMTSAQSLMKALNRAYEVEEHRKFLPARMVALSITVALFVTLVGLIGLLVVGRNLQAALLPPALEGSAVAWLIAAGRFVAALLLLVLLFAFVYWVGPNRERPEWEWLSPGAIIGVIGWLAVAGGFTLYARTVGDYQATYGTLAGAVVLLLWLQLSMLVLLLGAELNSELEKARDRRRAELVGHGFADAVVQTRDDAPVIASPPARHARPPGARVGVFAALLTAVVGFVVRRRERA